MIYRIAFERYLREIPPNFSAIARDRDKRNLVRNHLRAFYRKLPTEREVEIVLERIVTLSLLLEGGRESVEDKPQQHKFKAAEWGKRKRCELCGHKFKDFQDVTLDHILPMSLGGPEKTDNWQLTCGLCNVQKQEYWGISDLSRLVCLRARDGNFFSIDSEKVFSDMRLPRNPTRYWVFERGDRSCSKCSFPASETKLCVALQETHFLPTVDNLGVYCTDCADALKLLYCE